MKVFNPSQPKALSIEYECKRQIRQAKKIISVALARINDEAENSQAKLHAVSLLQRSVKLKHDRLAIERFRVAVQLSADIDEESLNYCRKLISDFNRKYWK